MTSEFVSIMDRIGHDAKVVFTDVQKYLPPAEGLAEVLFPGVAAAVPAINLVTSAIASVEQKFVVMGAPSGSGPQKAAEVIAIVGPAVTALLASEKVSVNSTELNEIVTAVCAVLNVQPTAS